MAAIIVFKVSLLLLTVTVCSTQNVTFILQEDLPNSTFIGNIVKDSKLSNKYSPGDLLGVIYDIYEIKLEYKKLFRLDSATSYLYSNTIIDREQDGICKYLMDCYFDFKVLAHKTTINSSIFDIIDVRVNVTDVNDNAPQFQNSELTLELSEATTQYTKIPLPSAIDLDTGKGNGVQSYTLAGATDFKLVQESQALYLSVENSLDRERTASYLMYLKAMDGGNPIRTGTLTIRLNILDENDNKPVFLESNVDVDIDETAKAGTLVKQLSAKDLDAGKNGEVFYRLKSFQQKEINDSFSIDDTGKLTLAKPLVYEQGKIYTVIVEAVDKGTIPLSAQATVNVYVIDIGNNPPQISVNFLSNEVDGDAVKISEGSGINTLVAVIMVKDTDSGENGDVSCFTYSTYFGLSTISQTDYRLIVQHKLDRETMDTHNVTVTCKDKGQPEMDDSVSFRIILKDENDNPPRFSEYYYNVELQENVAAGYNFFTVRATDADIGDNGNITYEIYPNTDDRFTINPINGKIFTKAVFDREVTSQVIFQVLARDHGTPPLESKSSVVVDITDVNDNRPEFIKPFADFTISENMQNGTLVDTVSAYDLDKGANGQFVLLFDPKFDTSSLPFTIFSTGEIITKAVLDREKQSQYTFPVIAVDKGSPPLTGTTTVRIRVTDQNDNKPVFTFPQNENNTITIPNTIRDESIIATIQAYDADSEENGNVNFFINSGDEENRFYLNPTTGSLHIKSAAIMDINGDKRFRLKIEARDRGSPPLNSTTDLNIIIQHLNTTTAKLTESNEYILISVLIVCITFVCAVCLIAVICFLKRKNIACGKNDRYIESNLPPQYDQVQSTAIKTPYLVQNDTNKLRVKFTEPGTTFTKQQMMDNLTLKKKDSPRKEKDDNPYNFDKQLHQKQPEESETSSKTDSGHGSEEDHPLDKLGRQYSLNNKQTVPQYNNSSGIYVMLDKNKTINHDIPQTYNVLERLPSREKNKYLDDSLLTSSLNSMWSESNPTSSRHPSNSQNSLQSPWLNDQKFNFPNNTPFYMALGSIHSRDDDGSTTTSGSYTINHDDLEDDDFSNRPKDLFV